MPLDSRIFLPKAEGICPCLIQTQSSLLLILECAKHSAIAKDEKRRINMQKCGGSKLC